MADSSAVSVWIGNRDLTHFARLGRVRIDDVLNDAPNTAALSVVLTPKLAPSFTAAFDPPAFDAGAFNTVDGPLVMTTPTVAVGAPIGIFINGGVDQIFGGEVLTREQYAEFDRPQHVRLDLTCTDFTRRLNYRKVSKDYGTASATAIVLDVVANFAPTITTTAVQAGLPSLSGGITFTFEDVSRALSRIAEKIGAYWYVDYAANLHFFTGTETGATPAPIVPGGRFADLKISADLAQVRTRILVEGDGATVALTLPAGDTVLPVSQTVPFNPAGGLATLGAARISYTGIVATGPKTNTTGILSGGSSAGPPPTPPTAPTVALAAASNPGGLAGGPYYYRVTFELSDGSRSDVGAYAGPVTIAAAAAPPPTNAAYAGGKGPIAVGVASYYATAFVAADGKTTNATLGGSGLIGRTIDPPFAPIVGGGTLGPGLAAGYYDYAFTFLTPAGETVPSFVRGLSTSGGTITVQIRTPVPDSRVVGVRVYRSSVNPSAASPPGLPWRHVVDQPASAFGTVYVDGTPDANLSAKNYPPYSTATDVGEAATVTVPTSADPRVARRRVYRKDGAGEYRLIAEIPDNATGTYTDVTIGSGGDLAPTINAIGSGAVSVSNIAIGPAGTVRRRIFRTAANGSQYREVMSVEDNSTTAVLDTIADSNLGGAPQPPLGTPATAGTVPPTPVGQNYLQVTTVAGFPPAGWLLLESGMMLRYAAIDAAGPYYIGGIPVTGLGSITATIPAGSIVTLVPALVGVAPVLPVTLGDAVQLLAQVDDVPAQTALAAIEGGDGVIEFYIQDRRLGQAGAQARGLAELALFKMVETKLTYSTHDVETKSGRTVHVDMPAPTNLTGDFLIQRVTIDDVSIAANWNPKRKVQASTTRFSFEDVLARLLLEQT